jgi:hypothetical protein
MSSTCSSDDVIDNARSKADYARNEIKSDYARFMMEYGTGNVVLTHSVVATFRKKWEKQLADLENMLFTLTLDPTKAGCVPQVQAMLDELRALIEENVFMMDNYLVDKGDAPVVETPEEQKAREREERRKRMEAFQKGEHLE